MNKKLLSTDQTSLCLHHLFSKVLLFLPDTATGRCSAKWKFWDFSRFHKILAKFLKTSAKGLIFSKVTGLKHAILIKMDSFPGIFLEFCVDIKKMTMSLQNFLIAVSALSNYHFLVLWLLL